jgi:hypothetical protein
MPCEPRIPKPSPKPPQPNPRNPNNPNPLPRKWLRLVKIRKPLPQPLNRPSSTRMPGRLPARLPLKIPRQATRRPPQDPRIAAQTQSKQAMPLSRRSPGKNKPIEATFRHCLNTPALGRPPSHETCAILSIMPSFCKRTTRALIAIRVFLRLTSMDVCCGPPASLSFQ